MTAPGVPVNSLLVITFQNYSCKEVTITGELLKEKHIMKEKRKCSIHNSEIYDKNKNWMGIVYTIQKDNDVAKLHHYIQMIKYLFC
jgi:hypothetical protein